MLCDDEAINAFSIEVEAGFTDNPWIIKTFLRLVAKLKCVNVNLKFYNVLHPWFVMLNLRCIILKHYYINYIHYLNVYQYKSSY